ncbi:unnamed protein product [Dovyalis caffra]|uniref:PGG domain-containing protein n=1 Tax=Dovyalis caffra TaxID=77055 RepID=A0AAV1SF06_9ROSI|nr:unnamed protein product [Dovyalis caffra]
MTETKEMEADKMKTRPEIPEEFLVDVECLVDIQDSRIDIKQNPKPGTQTQRMNTNPEKLCEMDLPEQSVTYMDPALYKAAVQGKIDPFKFYQTSLNQLLTPNKNTILHVYLENQIREPESSAIVDRILEMCPPLLLQPNIKGEIPLHFAARHDLANVVTVLIDRAKALPFDLESGLSEAKKMLRMTNAEKDTALHVAAQNLRSRVVEILTKEDREFLYSANHYRETPLYLVTNMKIFSRPKVRARRMVIDTILSNCKLVDYRGPNGRTALHAAVMNDDHAYIVDTDKKRTALHIAAIQGNAEVIEEIVSACPTCCELVDNRGWNALHYAVASTKRREVFGKAVKISKLGQLIYEKDEEGNTPLHLLAAFSKFSWYILPYEFRTSKSKMCGVNKQGLSVDDLLKGNFPEKKKEILESLADFGSGPHGRIVVNKKKDISEIQKSRESDLVTAVLIATVTFAVAFTLPGGYKNEQGPAQGTAILSKKAAFIAFVISDTMSMVLSLSAVFIHFFMSPFRPSVRNNFTAAAILTELSMATMVIAFVTGTYAMLAPNLGLAIATSFIGLSFFIITYIVVLNRIKKK